MRLPSIKLGGTRIFIALGFYLFFAALSFFAYSRQSNSDWENNSYVFAAIGSFTGPFAGAMARNFQSCCVAWSLTILPYCAGVLAFGVVMQVVPLRIGRAERAVRMAGWCVGLLGWFGGVPVSLAHALG